MTALLAAKVRKIQYLSLVNQLHMKFILGNWNKIYENFYSFKIGF